MSDREETDVSRQFPVQRVHFSDDIQVQGVCDALNRHGIGQYVRFVRNIEQQRDALRRLAEVFVPAGVNIQLHPWQREALEECFRTGAFGRADGDSGHHD